MNSKGENKTDIRTDELFIGFQKYVTRAKPKINFVLSCHLWAEHLLVRCLYRVMPKPDDILNDRWVGFPKLVQLATEHGVIASDFADILRLVNAFRNKFAHRLGYKPAAKEIRALQRALRDMKNPFYMSYMGPSQRELELLLSVICGHLQRRAHELGATDIKTS